MLVLELDYIGRKLKLYYTLRINPSARTVAKVPPKEKVGVGRGIKTPENPGGKKSQICEEVVRIFKCFYFGIVK